jgi:hypothetical protein
MSWAVNNVAGSLAGTQNAAKIAKRDVEKRKPAPNRRADNDAYDHVAEATEVEHAEAVRSLKDNTQEETHEDRREHGEDFVSRRSCDDATREPPAVYSPAPTANRQPVRDGGKRVDLEG